MNKIKTLYIKKYLQYFEIKWRVKIFFGKRSIYYTLLIVLFSISNIQNVYSQSTDSTTIKPFIFSGSASITNKGISTFPNFTLGKPAAIFNFSMGNRFSFDPLFRFSMKGQPWAFIFWLHYKLINDDKFSLLLGAHPAFTFKTIQTVSGNETHDELVSKRYLATQLLPTYSISKNVKVGMHYIYSKGVEFDTPKNNHFITINTTISTNSFANDLSFSVKPEFYYLKMDENDGTYFTANMQLTKKDFPFAISGIINKTIDSQISGDDFLWNISLIYKFQNKHLN